MTVIGCLSLLHIIANWTKHLNANTLNEHPSSKILSDRKWHNSEP